MRFCLILILMMWIISSCEEEKPALEGLYSLEVEGLKNISSGELELVGSESDCFGQIRFLGERKRSYELGLRYHSNDSLDFILPGNGGFLRLKKSDSTWVGKFKYFGLQADINAKKVGEPSKAFQMLTKTPPIGSGVISTLEEESFPSFDGTSQTLYFTRNQKIYFSKMQGNEWSKPSLISFSDDYNDTAPALNPDGNGLLFTSNRPLPQSDFKKKNLWISNKVDEVWDEPNPLPYPINIDSLGDYHGHISANNRVYFVSYNRTGGFGRSDIYSAALENDSLSVENLGSVINTELSEADVFIDPEERYLLFASTGRDDSYGADDIYISINQNGIWTTPVVLGPEVNSYAYEYGAWVDSKNNFLYFNSYRRGTSDIYKVSLSDIELLSPFH